MKKWVTIIMLVLAGGSLVLLGGCKHHRGNEARLDFVVDYIDEVLDLNAVQQQKLDQIRQELTTEALALQESRQKMHPMFKEQLASEKIDTTKIKKAVAEQREQFGRVIDLAIDRFAEFHASLSPVQRQKLVAKLEKMEKWHEYKIEK